MNSLQTPFKDGTENCYRPETSTPSSNYIFNSRRKKMATDSPHTSPPLPEGWTRGTTPSMNQQFWVHAATNIKTYYDPRQPNPHQHGFAPIPVEGESLPEGWEVVGREVDGRKDVAFLDHNTHTSTNIDPRTV